MKTLSPEKSRKLRGLIAKALDKASSRSEKKTCELAVCKLLAEFGLGVDGDPGLEIALISDDEMRAQTIPAVTIVNISSDGDERKERYAQSIFNDLFGGAGFGNGGRRRQR